jgi:aquaporin Z
MKLLTEFVGTFIFLFVISLVGVEGGPALAPVAIGGALMCMVYMGGHRSGAHYNPAVTFALFLQKKVTGSELFGYWIAQITAGILAFFLGNYVTDKTVVLKAGSLYTPMQAFLVEIIFTMGLALVVTNVAASKKTEGKGFYGLAIGFFIVVAAISAGGISGGSFNPAVSIGATLVDVIKNNGSWSYLWVVTAGPLIGGALGSFVFAVQEGAAD